LGMVPDMLKRAQMAGIKDLRHSIL
jgi:hypothetical protein